MPVMKIKFMVSVYIEKEDAGRGYHAWCPAYPGIHIDGRTIKQTLERVLAAVVVYIVSLVKHGDPIPGGVEIEHIDNARIYTREVSISVAKLQKAA